MLAGLGGLDVDLFLEKAMTYFFIAIAFLSGVLLAVYRLKGDRTIIETLRAMSGGPGPRDR